MRFDLKKPCPECPFRRTDGAVRLSRGRAHQVAQNMVEWHGGSFPCHKTNRETGGKGPVQYCAGALIFCAKNNDAGRGSNQSVAVAHTLGLFNPDEMEAQDEVFDTVEEMEATALDAPKK